VAGQGIKSVYEEQGFFSPLPVISSQEAQQAKLEFERAEETLGPLHYQDKIHTVLKSAWQLATHRTLLDAVEEVLGPDVLLYNVTYIVKEPESSAYVAWHQDLTYWGLSSDDQVSAWLALSPATEDSGCMAMVPRSHHQGQVNHQLVDDETNVLYNGQYVPGVDEDTAVLCPLAPGEASLHHGWTLHASRPNISRDRRIGLNMQFVSPKVHQTLHEKDSAILVRGVDRFNHFGVDDPPMVDLDPQAIKTREEKQAIVKGAYLVARGQE